MHNYYSQKLSAERLEQCYKIAPPRIKQYLSAEIDTILHKINYNDLVLDLGCGYGRVFKYLNAKTKQIIGLDISDQNLKYAQRLNITNISIGVFQMNAVCLGFKSNIFDLVFCIQNGISAFKEDPVLLIKEAVRVTRPGGKIMFSSYSNKIWNERLKWFELQATHGLIGEIDFSKTQHGIIICYDGFRASTFAYEDFETLTKQLDDKVNVYEIDNSSLFCEIIKSS